MVFLELRFNDWVWNLILRPLANSSRSVNPIFVRFPHGRIRLLRKPCWTVCGQLVEGV